MRRGIEPRGMSDGVGRVFEIGGVPRRWRALMVHAWRSERTAAVSMVPRLRLQGRVTTVPRLCEDKSQQ